MGPLIAIALAAAQADPATYLATWNELLKTTLFYGGAFVFTVGVLYLVLWLGYIVINAIRDFVAIGKEVIPRVANEHVNFLKKTDENNTKTVRVLETLAQTKQTEHRKTHIALGHLAEAHRATTDNPTAHAHIDAAKKVLEDAE